MHSFEGYAETVTLVPRWALARVEVPGMSMSDDFPPVDFSGAGDNMERALRDPVRRAMTEEDALYEIERQSGEEGLLVTGFPERALVGKSLGAVAREKELSLFDTALWLARNGLPETLGGVVWTMKAVGTVDIEDWMCHDWNGVALDRATDDTATRKRSPIPAPEERPDDSSVPSCSSARRSRCHSRSGRSRQWARRRWGSRTADCCARA